MSVCEFECRTEATEEVQLGGLSGLELQHDLYLTLPDWTVWESVSSQLAGAGAELQSLQIQRQNSGFSARCRLKRITSEAARGLSAQLQDTGLVERASVEHLMLARSAA